MCELGLACRNIPGDHFCQQKAQSLKEPLEGLEQDLGLLQYMAGNLESQPLGGRQEIGLSLQTSQFKMHLQGQMEEAEMAAVDFAVFHDSWCLED